MFPALVNTVLTWLHIFSAIGWMGTAMFFVIVLSRVIPGLSQPTRTELLSTLFPRFIRYVAVFSTLTIIFGGVLTIGLSGPSGPSLNDTWGLSITVGALVALIGFGIAHGLVLPAARKIARLSRDTQKMAQQVPSVDGARLQRRMRIGGTVVLFLLVVSLVFMVTAAELA